MRRLGIALRDPYIENSTVDAWSQNPSTIARACFAAMGKERATDLLAALEADATFILQTAQSRTRILEEKTA